MRKSTIPPDRMIRMYCAEGMPLRDIARAAGVSWQAVHSALRRRGVRLRPRRPTGRRIRRRLEGSVLEGLYVREGMSIKEIAQSLGTCYRTVRRELRRNGIEQRPYPTPRYQELPHLRVGGAVDYPLAGFASRKSAFATIHQAARSAGIRVSLRTLPGGGSVRATRIA